MAFVILVVQTITLKALTREIVNCVPLIVLIAKIVLSVTFVKQDFIFMRILMGQIVVLISVLSLIMTIQLIVLLVFLHATIVQICMCV